MIAVAVQAPVAALMPAMTAAAGITRVDTNMKDRASRRENAIAIDRWEDEGGAGESPAKNSATPRPMPNQRDVGVPPPPGRDTHPEPSCARGDLLPFAGPADS